MPLEEVGTVPGSYRIVDMFCLREVLNQIMKCSCRSEEGFSLYQNLSTSTMSSFHCVLDIVCRACSQKVSFGTSTLVTVSSSTDTASTKPDIDCKLSRLQLLSVRSLWCVLHQADWAQHDHEPRLQLDQDEVELDLIRPEPSHEEFNCSLERNADLDCSVQLECPLPDTPLDLEDCTITNTSVTLDCATSSSQSSSMSSESSKELLATSNIQSFFLHKPGKPSLEKISTDGVKICQFCKKGFKKVFNLKQHIRTHTNERPLKCGNCEKRFNDRSSMNKHARTVHADFKPHICKICGKHFSSTSHVMEHQATHTHSKKFGCNLCDKKFAFRSSLNKHLVIHSDQVSEDRKLLQLKDCELDGL